MLRNYFLITETTHIERKLTTCLVVWSKIDIQNGSVKCVQILDSIYASTNQGSAVVNAILVSPIVTNNVPRPEMIYVLVRSYNGKAQIYECRENSWNKFEIQGLDCSFATKFVISKDRSMYFVLSTNKLLIFKDGKKEEYALTFSPKSLRIVGDEVVTWVIVESINGIQVSL